MDTVNLSGVWALVYGLEEAGRLITFRVTAET